ncbi:MAG: aminotransferase class I/II-fold pyridoxal phosphate-dependent enzyme [Methanomethylovorans sp.]|uniref:aminotransferase class I/II-fold pyridoxal phosphate-dependent enzyme n=1 Tax=Methanomethylovorans sp. TaxID=2758717 RepID=UPI000ACFC8BB|nr:aminotransferase class I/II-fold pyridoxal phosphate-dependent enzyme [Methanomethylovorans sp.]
MEKKRAVLNDNASMVAQCHHGILQDELRARTGPQNIDVLDFSTRLNPMGNIFQYQDILDLHDLIGTARTLTGQYPDNRYLEFRDAAAGFIGKGLTSSNIIPGSGVCEIIRLVLGCTLEKRDIVLIPFPSPPEYSRHSNLFGARVILLPPHELLLADDKILSSAKVVLLSNPGDLGGRLIPSKELRSFAKRCAKNRTLLIIDESCIELSDPSQTLAGHILDNDFVVVLRSITHAFAIPGLNAAYAAASKKMAQLFNNARLPWSIGAFADVLCTAVLNVEGGVNSRYLKDSRELIHSQRDYLIERIGRIHGFSPRPSDANYLLVELKDLFMDSHTLTRNLAAKGFLIKDCSDLFQAGKQFVRISVHAQEDNETLLRTIGEVLTETSKEDARERLEVTIGNAAAGSVPASRGTCQYYPCHFWGQDCTFCFCPFYACEDERTGGKWIIGSSGNKVWSCENCTYIHQSRLSRQILDILMEEGDTEDNIKKAWDLVIKPLI